MLGTDPSCSFPPCFLRWIAGRYCKQEKLPILDAGVSYVYELQEQLKESIAKQLLLMPTFQKLKGEVSHECCWL